MVHLDEPFSFHKIIFSSNEVPVEKYPGCRNQIEKDKQKSSRVIYVKYTSFLFKTTLP